MAKMKPEEMRGGLNALFNRSDQHQAAPIEEQPAAAPEAPATEGAADPAPSNREAIFDTLEDETKELVTRHTSKTKRGRPRKGEAHIPADQDYQRITTIVPKEEWAKFREIAEREHLQLKDVMEMALRLAVEIYEKKNGKLLVADKHTGEKAYLFKM